MKELGPGEDTRALGELWHLISSARRSARYFIRKVKRLLADGYPALAKANCAIYRAWFSVADCEYNAKEAKKLIRDMEGEMLKAFGGIVHIIQI